MTIEGAISYYEGQAVYAKDHGYPLAGDWNGQIAAWLRELQERRNEPEERTETHVRDLISRQAAIDAIHCDIVITGRENAELVAKTMGEFVDRIKALPSAQPDTQCYLGSPCEYQNPNVEISQPESKTGEWVLKDHLWECNKCGCRINVANPFSGNDWNYDFCPHCGTKMIIAAQRML